MNVNNYKACILTADEKLYKRKILAVIYVTRLFRLSILRPFFILKELLGP